VNQSTTTLVEPARPRAELPPPDQRGGLIIAHRVVEKIVTKAVAEVDQAAGVTRHVIRVGRPRHDRRSRVWARVDGDIAFIRVEMAIQWPASIPEVASHVREHLAARLWELASLRVAGVDITVTELPMSLGSGRRVR
jgi:uncharacterized alkaline shock family protein YloU